MSSVLIDLKEVAVSQREFNILSNINLKISKGEFLYLIGKTGSGKSSLLKLLYGDIPLKSGEATIFDYDLKELKTSEIPFLRRKIGIVFQDFQLLSDRSVYNNLEFVLKATGWKDKSEIKQRIDEVLSLVNMSKKGYKMPYELSGGEQQRIAIARALLNKPELILADEPTGNLDPITSEEIMQVIINVAKEVNCTLLMATHDFNLIKRFNFPILKCESGTITKAETQNLFV